jgi:hypothetical protein
MDILFSSCLLQGDFWQKQLATVLLPISVFLGFLFIASLVWKYGENREFWEKRLRANPFERAGFLFGAALTPMYTYILSVAMAPFRCYKQGDGSYSLVPSPNLDCYDEQWWNQWAVITLGLLYVILIPVFFMFVLWKNRGHFTSNKFIFRYGYLISGLKSSFYWWNVYQLFRKTALVMVIDLTNSFDPFLRTFFVIIVLLFSMIMEVLLQPRQEEGFSRTASIL